ncbi:MAG: nitroreductase family protein [Deltaproteobacteria bacterium]|nr:nitroreductase family protein [Deltaproteobacteria bacterium]
MELYEAIEKRRTIRIYKNGASEEQLRKILLAGTKAPSAVNRQPWEFIHIQDRKTIDQLADLKYQQTLGDPPKNADEVGGAKKIAMGQKDSFQNASIVAVCHLKDWEKSVWLCLENISLAAVAEGLGSGIVLFWGKTKEKVESILGLPEDYELTAVMKLGEPGKDGYSRDANPYAQKRPEFSWLHRDRFGQRD